MLIGNVMTQNPACCRPSDTLDIVAKMMLAHDCGEIPVREGKDLVGVITDRDIVLRAVALGKTPDTLPVRDVMTSNIYSVRESDTIDTALDLMERKLVRRLPVVDDSGALVGILSEADLVAKAPAADVARHVKTVARKTRGHARLSL